MGSDNNPIKLSESEFELIKSKVGNLPKEPLERIIAIAKAVNNSGIQKDRLADVFYEVCKRL